MRFRRRLVAGAPVVEMRDEDTATWRQLTGAPQVKELLAGFGADDSQLLGYLQLEAGDREKLRGIAAGSPASSDAQGDALLPIEPKSFRDFMLYEKHVIDASRAMVKRYMPVASLVARVVEGVTGKPFSMFRPHKLWRKQAIYYFGNHVTMLADGEEAPWPDYGYLMDYELEVGAILAKPLFNATADQAAEAIGGFLVLNDLSARNVQIDEMRSGFGPQKSKHFASSLSAEVVTADEILPHLDTLTGSVFVNGDKVANVSSAGAQFSLPEAIAHASEGVRLAPGELFGSGTLPGGAGIENGALPKPGDEITLTIDQIGSVTNRFAATSD